MGRGVAGSVDFARSLAACCPRLFQFVWFRRYRLCAREGTESVGQGAVAILRVVGGSRSYTRCGGALLVAVLPSTFHTHTYTHAAVRQACAAGWFPPHTSCFAFPFGNSTPNSLLRWRRRRRCFLSRCSHFTSGTFRSPPHRPTNNTHTPCGAPVEMTMMEGVKKGCSSSSFSFAIAKTFFLSLTLETYALTNT